MRHTHRIISLTLPLVFLGCAMPGKPKDVLVLEAGQHSLPDLLQQAAKFLEQDVPSASVALLHRLELDSKGCEAAFGKLLYDLRFEDLSSGSMNIKRPLFSGDLSKSADFVLMPPDDVRRLAKEKAPVLVMVDLKHADSGTVFKRLRPLLAGGGQVAAGSGMEGTLWVAAPMDVLPKILEAIEELDQAKEPIEPTLEPTR